jgi:hypothetical protein
VKAYLQTFLMLELEGGKLSASRTGHFIFWIGGRRWWLRKKIPLPHSRIQPRFADSPARGLATVLNKLFVSFTKIY